MKSRHYQGYTPRDIQRMLNRRSELALKNLDWLEVQNEVYSPQDILQENADSQFVRKWLSLVDEKEQELLRAQMQYARDQKGKNGIDDLIIG